MIKYSFFLEALVAGFTSESSMRDIDSSREGGGNSSGSFHYL